MKNWHLKLGSLLAAIFLAIFVNYFFTPTEFGTSVVQLIAPVEIKNVPKDKSVIWPATRQVEITVQGSSLFLSKVALSPPVVRVALPEGADKKFIAKLSIENVNLPATVRLLGIKPSELEFGLDDIIEKAVPIVVPEVGVLSNELKLERILVEPTQVKLRGPSQELNGLSFVKTVPLNLSSIFGMASTELELSTPWSLVESKIKSVKVNVEVSDIIDDSSFLNVPVQLEVLSDSLKSRNPHLAQKLVTVSLRGPKKILKTIKKENLLIRAELTSEAQLKDSLDLSLDPIKSIELVEISPRRLAVLVDPLPTPTAVNKGKMTSKK